MSTGILRRLVPAAAGLALLTVMLPAGAQTFTKGSSGTSGQSFSTTSFGSSGGSGSGFGGSGSGFNMSSSGGGNSGTGGSNFSLGVNSILTNTNRTSGSATSVGGTTFTGPSLGSPISMGLQGLTSFAASSANPSVIRSNSYGTAMFNISSYVPPSGGSFGTRTFGNTGGTATVTVSAAGVPMYASSVGIRKSPTYLVEPDFEVPAVPFSRVTAEVRSAVENSPRLRAPGNNVQVFMDGPVVILRGTVNRRDRFLVEDVIRLVPGVRDVRNELVVNP
jgi:hypothetical protein